MDSIDINVILPIIISSIFGVLTIILNYFFSKREINKIKAETNKLTIEKESIQADVDDKYREMLKKEIESRERDRAELRDLQKRFDDLEEDFRRLLRAYRLSLFLNKLHAREYEVPDFLDVHEEWNTDKLINFYNKYYKST